MNGKNSTEFYRTSVCTRKEIRDLLERVKSLLGDDGHLEYLGFPKLEGLSVALVYKKGELEIARILENDYRREYVTANIKTILTVPLTLVQLDENYAIPDLLLVHGHIYMESEAFLSLNQSRRERGISLFEHLVDAVADSLRQPNPRITAKRKLNIFCCGVGEYIGPSCKTQMDALIMLQNLGFRVNRPLIKVCSGIDEVLQYCDHLEEIRARVPFIIDGAIIKLNRLSRQEKLLEEDERLGLPLAFKFK